jgi:hypothetical protein
VRFTDAEVAEWVRQTAVYATSFGMVRQLIAALELEREAVSPHSKTAA